MAQARSESGRCPLQRCNRSVHPVGCVLQQGWQTRPDCHFLVVRGTLRAASVESPGENAHGRVGRARLGYVFQHCESRKPADVEVISGAVKGNSIPATFPCMRVSLVCALLLMPVAAGADEREDRANIERLIGALNDDAPGAAQKRSLLFTPDAEIEFDRLSRLDRRLMQRSDTPWSEVTRPRMVIRSVQFITPEVALVDAANTQYGSVILVRRVPVLLVMKKEREWRIASLRILVNLADLP